MPLFTLLPQDTFKKLLPTNVNKGAFGDVVYPRLIRRNQFNAFSHFSNFIGLKGKMTSLTDDSKKFFSALQFTPSQQNLTNGTLQRYRL